MPVNPALFNVRHFFLLAPEISLAVWGLVVLLADVLVFRHRPHDRRAASVSQLAVVGAVVSFAAALVPLLVRTYPDLPAWMNVARVDYLVDPDPILFFGTISSDLLTETFNVLVAGLFLLVVWMSPTYAFTEEWGEYYALIYWSTVGMMLLIASEELITLFLTLEMMTICLYLATAFEKGRRRSAEGGLKYFVYGSVSSALFLYGISLVYGLTGSTQFFSIRQALEPVAGNSAGLSGNVAGATAVLLLLVGFGFKVGSVPFHMWVPDAYEGAPAPVTAWVATGSKIASFIAMMKVLGYALGRWSTSAGDVAGPGWIGVVAVLSAASMTYGNFAALAQTNFKRMLAYSSIAHAGYMLVGVAAAGISVKFEAAAGAVLFYLLAYGFATLGAFAVAAWLARDKGSDEIADLEGVAARYPFLATCLLLLMLSLIGLPPLAGFFGKLYMFMEALDQGRGGRAGRLTLLWLVALGLLNSVVSAFYYVRVMKAMFLRPPSGPDLKAPPRSVAVTVALGTAVTVALGVMPAPVVNLTRFIAVPMLTESSEIGRYGVVPPSVLETPPPPPAENPVTKNAPENRPVLILEKSAAGEAARKKAMERARAKSGVRTKPADHPPTSEPKAETKPETKAQPKPETKAEPKGETKPAPKTEAKPETKAAPAAK